MRSRYSAFALGTDAALEYLVATHHPEHRGLDLTSGLRQSLATVEAWEGLEIRAAEHAGARGMVEFVATYRVSGQRGRLHERSEFRLERGRWFYTRGEIQSS